jgi:hypothetical protein
MLLEIYLPPQTARITRRALRHPIARLENVERMLTVRLRRSQRGFVRRICHDGKPVKHSSDRIWHVEQTARRFWRCALLARIAGVVRGSFGWHRPWSSCEAQEFPRECRSLDVGRVAQSYRGCTRKYAMDEVTGQDGCILLAHFA